MKYTKHIVNIKSFSYKFIYMKHKKIFFSKLLDILIKNQYILKSNLKLYFVNPYDIH